MPHLDPVAWMGICDIDFSGISTYPMMICSQDGARLKAATAVCLFSVMACLRENWFMMVTCQVETVCNNVSLKLLPQSAN